MAFPGEQAGEMGAFVAEQVAAEPVSAADAREAFLLERIAQISWQVDRAERAEEAQAVVRAAEAQGLVQKRRSAEVAGLASLIENEPARAMQDLLESKKGCQWVIDSLRELIDAVDADWWLCPLDNRGDAICAPAQPGRLRISRAKALALALGSAKHEGIWPDGIPGLEHVEASNAPEDFREWCRRKAEILRDVRPKWGAELKTILARRLAEVERRLDELNVWPDPAQEYADLASTFDVSEQAERLRRYGRSRERERRKFLEELEPYRLRRAEAPNGPEPVAVPVPPLPPFEPPPDAAPNDNGYGLNTQDLTEKVGSFRRFPGPPPADRAQPAGERSNAAGVTRAVGGPTAPSRTARNETAPATSHPDFDSGQLAVEHGEDRLEQGPEPSGVESGG